jgi:hypothetical protein
VRPEHATEINRLIPNAQLAVSSAADHFLLCHAPERMVRTIAAFFDAPIAAAAESR